MDSLASVGNILSKRDIILLFTSGLAQGNSSQNLESFCDNSSTKFHGDIGSRGCRSSNKPQCQLCGKMSLTALKCYHHFDPFFTGFVFCFCYPLNSNTVITTLGSYTHYSLIFSCYLSNSYTSTTTSGFSSNVGQTQAILVTPNTEDSKAWFLDSSATNHVTNKFNNLNIRSNL